MTVADFLPVPYVPCGRDMKGLDCWNLCLLAGKELFGKEFPEYFYSEADILPEAQAHIARELTMPRWQKLDKPEPGAIGIMRIKAGETHTVLFLDDNEFIHTLPGRNVTIASIHHGDWKQRLVDIRRWNPQT
jgi:cell wall-associated NlpC family hydrolase